MKDSAERLGVTLSRIDLIATRILSRFLREAGIKEISPEQARILNVLWKVDMSGTPPVSIGILVRETQLSKPTMTIMLNRLEKNGYITRVPSEDDHRVVLIKRTGKDKYLEEVYTNIADAMSAIATEGFTPKEVEQFRNYLKRILKNLMEYYTKKDS